MCKNRGDGEATSTPGEVHLLDRASGARHERWAVNSNALLPSYHLEDQGLAQYLWLQTFW